MDCKEFLEKAIELSNQIKTLMSFENSPEGVELCDINPNYIQVYKGINILADLFGKELLTEPRTNPEVYSFEYYFEYGGRRILQIDNDPPEKMA